VRWKGATVTDEPKAAPPGWYQIPDGRWLYWDGRQWTHNVTMAAPSLARPYTAKKSGALKWILLGLGLFLVVGGGTCVALIVTDPSGRCDPAAVATFESLPVFPGVDVDLQGSPGNGCTDTVQPPDPAAFIAHYERVMRDAGWPVSRDGEGLLGTGPAGPVSINNYEGDDVVVFIPSAGDFPPSEGP
jgi:hypothetical protein